MATVARLQARPGPSARRHGPSEGRGGRGEAPSLLRGLPHVARLPSAIVVLGGKRGLEGERRLEVRASSAGDSTTKSTVSLARGPFGFLPELKGWREVEGAWVLQPEGRPKAVVHFLGGAFIGAAPHLSYTALMEALVAAGYVVVCTPYLLTFKHLESARGVESMFAAAVSALALEDPGVAGLPVYGVGHSNGALLQLLLGTFADREHYRANVIMSFNSKPVSEAIPGGLPEGAGGLLSGLRSMARTLPVEGTLQAALNAVPLLSAVRGDALVASVLPVAQQVGGVLAEIADGTLEFEPTPEGSKDMVAEGYEVPRNLLVMFDDDSFDETPDIRDILASPSVSARGVQFEVLLMEGWHGAPCGVDLGWQPGGAFSPVDAVGMAVKEQVLKNTKGVARKVVSWLDEQAV